MITLPNFTCYFPKYATLKIVKNAYEVNISNEKITIQEIAKLSGVSVSTVSRVLNNSPSVSAAKRKKIQAIIDEHNYTPSVFARGMVNKQTKNIGVILPDISNPYFISLITQIQNSR